MRRRRRSWRWTDRSCGRDTLSASPTTSAGCGARRLPPGPTTSAWTPTSPSTGRSSSTCGSARGSHDACGECARVSFVAAPLLLGLLLVAVPLWLHRTHREAPRRGFSSLFLMRAAEEPVHAERTLRYLVLLALRCAVLAAAALAFAGPVLSGLWRDDGGAGDVADGRVPLVVLDRSLSMARVGVWDEAVRQVERLATNRSTVVVGAGAELELLTTSPGSIAPEASRLGLGGLVSRVAAVAANLPQRETGFAVHLVSDFQASAVPDRFNALIEGGTMPLTVHPVGRAEDNWAVESVRLSGDEAIARVASHAEARREVEVALRVADAVVD
ncbi:MAG: hypothetical protein F4X36_04755, partial [Gammaproteobacteria bacterium]|nr:hypothetical protein [Gammaproteobacteria bacterium]